MLRIVVEVLPRGFSEDKKELGVMNIMNDGTGEMGVGNYDCSLSNFPALRAADDGKYGEVTFDWVGGRVEGFDRSRGFWQLIYEALKQAHGE